MNEAKPTAVVAADLDLDGRTDLVVSSFALDSVRVLRDYGESGFALQTDVAVGRGPRSVVVDEVNGEGDADLVVVNQLSGTVTVLVAGVDGDYLRQP